MALGYSSEQNKERDAFLDWVQKTYGMWSINYVKSQVTYKFWETDLYKQWKDGTAPVTTTPAGTTATAVGPLSYDEIVASTGLSPLGKFFSIKAQYPNRLVKWLRTPEGANFVDYQGQMTPEGLVLLPDGSYWDSTAEMLMTQDQVEAWLARQRGTEQPPGPGVYVPGQVWVTEDGRYVDSTGAEYTPDDAQRLYDAYYGLGEYAPEETEGYVASYAEITNPDTGEIFRVGFDQYGNEVSRVSTGRFGETGGMSEWEQAQLSFRQQELSAEQAWREQQIALDRERLAAEQQWRQQELALERQREMARMLAQPASWLEYALYTGQPAVAQPWMKPLMPEQYGLGVGEVIPGWPGYGTPTTQAGLWGGQAPIGQALTGVAPTAQPALWGGITPTGGATAPTASPTGYSSTVTAPTNVTGQTAPAGMAGQVPTGVTGQAPNEAARQYTQYLIDQYKASGIPVTEEQAQALLAQAEARTQTATDPYAAAKAYYNRPAYARGTQPAPMPAEGTDATQYAMDIIAQQQGFPDWDTYQRAIGIQREAYLGTPATAEQRATMPPEFLRIYRGFGAPYEGGETPTQKDVENYLAGIGATSPSAAGGTYSPTQTAPQTQLWGGGQTLQPGDLSGMPQLTWPSRQYQARMGPSALQQYYGYEQARTGAIPEETQWRLWSRAAPGGSRMNLGYWR